MLKKIILLGLLAVTARADIQVTDVTETEAKTKDKKAKAKKVEEPEPYEVKRLKLGESDEENFSHFGIITNLYSRNLTREMLFDNNHPSLLYVCDSKAILQRDSTPQSIHMQTILPVLSELKGFGLFYMYDCSHPTALENKKTLKDPIFNTFMWQACRDENTDRYPTVHIYQEPPFRMNPFTGFKNKKIDHTYNSGQYSQSEFKSFIDRAMTDFTRPISNMEDYQTFILDQDERNINKCILFTDKDTVTNVMKALSAEFRDKIRFYVIHAVEDSPNAEFEEEILNVYGLKDRDSLPELILEQTYDPETNTTFEGEPTLHKYHEATFKIQKLKDFLRPFARKSSKLEPGNIEEHALNKFNLAEQGQFAQYQYVNEANFSSTILDNELPHLVYFTTLKAGDDYSKEYWLFNRLLRFLKGIVNIVIYPVDTSASDYEQLMDKYKLGKVAAGKPKVRFYPNKFTGDMKIRKSYKVFIENKANDLKKVIKQINDGYEADITISHSRDGLPALISNFVRQGKDVVFVLYGKKQQIELNFKSLTNHELLKDTTAFVGVRDPDLSKMSGVSPANMPYIGVVKASIQDNNSVRQYHAEGTMRADELLFSVMRFLDKGEALKQWVVKKNNEYPLNPAMPTFNLSGITHFLSKNNLIEFKSPVGPTPVPPKKSKKTKKQKKDEAK